MSFSYPEFLLVMMALAACQQGVVPGNAYDTPWSFTGKITPAHSIPATIDDDAGMPQPTRPMMGVLWTDPLQRVPDVPQPARGIESSVDGDKDVFQIDIYGPPPVQAMVEVPSPDGSMRLAYGEIVMLADQDGDGTFRVAGPDAAIAGLDRYLAGSYTVLVYLDRSYGSLPAGNIVAAKGDQGYQLAVYTCDNQTVDTVTPQDRDGGTAVYTQLSITFPDVRACARTHSP